MTLRKAELVELPFIWNILLQAIEQRKQDGSEQWQNGYPNEHTIYDDIIHGHAYVLVEQNIIIAYAALLFDEEIAYNDIIGNWLSNGVYAVVHRVATINSKKRSGVATQLFRIIEDLCIEKQVYSIKVDTNFDNIPMMKIFEKLRYIYCGEVFFNGEPRKAYEKMLEKV